MLKIEKEVKLNETNSSNLQRHSKLDADFTRNVITSIFYINFHDSILKW